MSLIPITVVTGMPGSGKSTLIQHLISCQRRERIAWLAESFPGSNTEAAVKVVSAGERISEVDSTAGRCSVRSDLIDRFRELQARQTEDSLPLDRVMVETCGPADPAPVIQSFFADEALCDGFRLDAVVTMLDAPLAMKQLDALPEVQDQVGFADRVVLIRHGELAADSLRALVKRLRRINPRARVLSRQFDPAFASELLDIRGFALTGVLDIDAQALKESGEDFEDGVGSFVFRTRQAFDKSRVEEFFSSLLLVYGGQLMRYKGVVTVLGADRPVVIQGVHRLMGTDADDDWKKGDPRDNRILFIGRKMPREVILRGLQACLVPPGAASAPPQREAIRHGSTVQPPFRRLS